PTVSSTAEGGEGEHGREEQPAGRGASDDVDGLAWVDRMEDEDDGDDRNRDADGGTDDRPAAGPGEAGQRSGRREMSLREGRTRSRCSRKIGRAAGRAEGGGGEE